MRDNVGIVEISSKMMRDLLLEACAPLGKVSVFDSVPAARREFDARPPKVLVLGGAPLDTAAFEFLQSMVRNHCAIALAFVDRHDLPLAVRAGAIDGYPRNAEGLRELKFRLRPLLAQSLRPPAEQHSIVTWSNRAPAGSGSLLKQLGSHTADQTIRNSEAPPPSAARPNSQPGPGLARCPLIAIASGPHIADGVAYVLSRLATTLPGIVLLQQGLGANIPAFVRRLNEESPWRAREARAGDVVQSGQVLVAPGHGQLRLALGAAGPEVGLAGPAAPSGGAADALFESVARASGGGAVAVLLGGANTGDDGLAGLRAVRAAAGYTITLQDGSSAAQRAQKSNPPHEPAADSGGPHERVALNELPQTIAAYCAARASARSA